MTTNTPLPLPESTVPSVAPKKRNPLVRLGIGCLSLIVISCVGFGGVVLYQNWQQDRNYQTGHDAYMQGNCAAALDPLGKAARGEPGSADNDTALKAKAELQPCEALLAATKLADDGKPADSVLAYSAMMTKYANSPLKQKALTLAQGLVGQSKPDTLAIEPLCKTIDDLATQLIIAKPAETVPPLLYACGQMYEATKDYDSALAAYDRFRSTYPDHQLAGDVRQAFVRATIAQAQLLGAGTLPAPQAVGSGSDSGGQVTVVIRNDSPEKLSMVFNGPDVRVEDLEACADCEKFTDTAPEECPGKGPIGRYVLAPGDYDVVVKASSDGGVTPFRGSWTLEGSQDYESCFYLVTSKQ